MKKIGIIIVINILLIFILIYSIFFIQKNNNKYNIENVKKSVVKIIPEQQLINYSNNPLGLNNNGEYGIGAGFFIDNNGKLLTANHVISNNNINYNIISYDNKKYKAKILNQDTQNDIAILQIETNIKYDYLKINKNFNYKINDNIYSFGVDGKNLSVIYTIGKITNINKKLDNISNLIEFLPQISKGFSGGPILNGNLEVIGLNYAIKNGKSYGIELSSNF